MKFYLLSPMCPPNPHLFPQFVETWKANGVEITDRIQDADVVLMDLHSRLFEYNQGDIDYLIEKSLPLVTFDEWDRGSMSNDVWPFPMNGQQSLVWGCHIGSQLHFCRLLDKTKPSKKVFPYEKPILYEEPLLTPDELFNRKYDIVYIANEAPSRNKIAQALLDDGRLKCYIALGQEKIPFNDFVDNHTRGKLFISSAAGGYTDERKQYLFSIAGVIQHQTDQLVLHELTHLRNCLKIDEYPTKEQLDTIVEICNHKELLYQIYKNGYDFMKKYYSKEYIATDILNKIKTNLCHTTTV